MQLRNIGIAEPGHQNQIATGTVLNQKILYLISAPRKRSALCQVAVRGIGHQEVCVLVRWEKRGVFGPSGG